MRKKVLVLLLIFTMVFTAFVFVSCKDTDELPSGEISSGDNNQNGDLPSGEIPSDDIDQDGEDNNKDEHIHTFSSEWSSDYDYHWRSSTCGHDVIRDNSAHVFEDEICQVCKFDASFGLIYEINADNKSCNVVGVKDKTTEEITVPSKYKNYTVYAIKDGAFENNNLLKSIKISEGITEIGEYAFYNCPNLITLELPETIKSTGFYAYSKCYNLQYKEFDNGLYLGNSSNPYVALVKAKNSSIESCVVNSNTKVIGNSAFYNCRSLYNIEIPDSVIHIDEKAFYGCKKLSGISIPKGISSIGFDVFRDCENLKSIELPTSVKVIGSSAFWGCSGLTEFYVSSKIERINPYAFYGCNAMTIYCEAETQPTGWYNEWNESECPVVWNCTKNEVADDGKSYVVLDTGLRFAIKDNNASLVRQSSCIEGEVIIPDSITYKSSSHKVVRIEEKAFHYNKNIVEINISDEIEVIDNQAFYNCSNLEKVTFGQASKLRTIGNEVFWCCKFANFEIPSGVLDIGSSALWGCSELTQIIIPILVTSMGKNVFYGCNSLTVYCESESQPSGWDIYWNRLDYNDNTVPVIWGYEK